MSLLSSNGKGNQKGVKALTGYKTVLRDQNNIFNNLQTTEKGVSRVINHQNTRLLAGMNRLADRGSAKLAQEVQKGHARATNLFGSALGTVVGQNLGPADAAAKGSALTSKATAQAGHAAAAAGAMSFAIEQQAVEAAKASAVYEASAAHSLRKQADQKAKDDSANQASGALLQLAQAGTPYSAIISDAKALASQYGLNLKQTDSLVDSVTSILGYDASNENSTSATYAPAPLVDQFGQPIPTDVGNDRAALGLVHSGVATAIAKGDSEDTIVALIIATFPRTSYPDTFINSAIALAKKEYETQSTAAGVGTAPPALQAAANFGGRAGSSAISQGATPVVTPPRVLTAQEKQAEANGYRRVARTLNEWQDASGQRYSWDGTKFVKA